MGRSVLARFDPPSKRFETVRDVSIRPGNFINIAAHCAPSDLSGLPPANGPQILLWGSGAYRRSHAYLACIAADQIENAQATSYFTGLSDTGLPLWSADESAAAPVVRHPVIGELSVSWCGALRIWLMTYNSTQPRGITLRRSRTPWGPWSEGILIFHPWHDGGYTKFMRAVLPTGAVGPHGPIAVPGGDPERIGGGEYGPYIIERFTRLADSTLTIYYVMSTWNPYTVVLMKSQLRVDFLACDEKNED